MRGSDGKESSGAKFLPLSKSVSLRIVRDVEGDTLMKEVHDEYDESDVPPLEAISAYY